MATDDIQPGRCAQERRLQLVTGGLQALTQPTSLNPARQLHSGPSSPNRMSWLKTRTPHHDPSSWQLCVHVADAV